MPRSSRSPPSPPPPAAGPFSIAPPFREEADTGSFHLGHFEAMYESLFAESLEGGEISPEERERLNLAAAALGLDAARVARLEAALLAACEARADVTLVDPEDPSTLADRAGPSEAPRESQVDVEPSDQKITLPPPRAPSVRREESYDDEGPTLARPKAAEERAAATAPRGVDAAIDDATLDARFDAAVRAKSTDLAWRIASVLVRRETAAKKHRVLFDAHRSTQPPRPQRAVTAEAWSRLLAHPDEDRVVGEIFAVTASAALIGRVSAMRRDGTLPKLEASQLQDATTSTVSAVRAIAWAAATLGMRAPQIYLAPELDAGFELLTAVPPVTRVGARMLSGQSTTRLAFFGARHLSWYREEHFVCTLVPSVAYLEDIFLAALTIGAPEIVLPADIRARTSVIAEAMRPCLEASQLERLQRLVARFLARGAGANLKAWARCAEWTSCRAGLLLCGDIAVAADALGGELLAAERVRQLERFWLGEQASALREQLGVSIG